MRAPPAGLGAALYRATLRSRSTGVSRDSATRKQKPATIATSDATVSTAGYPKRRSAMPEYSRNRLPGKQHQDVQGCGAASFFLLGMIHEEAEHAWFAHILERHIGCIEDRGARERRLNARRPEGDPVTICIAMMSSRHAQAL